MSFFAYVLKSKNKSYTYKGHCQDLDQRIKEHNSGKTKSLRPFIPVELVYYEEFLTLEEAIKQEKYFKTSAGRRYITKQLARSSMPARPTGV